MLSPDELLTQVLQLLSQRHRVHVARVQPDEQIMPVLRLRIERMAHRVRIPEVDGLYRILILRIEVTDEKRVPGVEDEICPFPIVIRRRRCTAGPREICKRSADPATAATGNPAAADSIPANEAESAAPVAGTEKPSGGGADTAAGAGGGGRGGLLCRRLLLQVRNCKLRGGLGVGEVEGTGGVGLLVVELIAAFGGLEGGLEGR